jgi:hypothetical protein
VCCGGRHQSARKKQSPGDITGAQWAIFVVCFNYLRLATSVSTEKAKSGAISAAQWAVFVLCCLECRVKPGDRKSPHTFITKSFYHRSIIKHTWAQFLQFPLNFVFVHLATLRSLVGCAHCIVPKWAVKGQLSTAADCLAVCIAVCMAVENNRDNRGQFRAKLQKIIHSSRLFLETTHRRTLLGTRHTTK